MLPIMGKRANKENTLSEGKQIVASNQNGSSLNDTSAEQPEMEESENIHALLIDNVLDKIFGHAFHNILKEDGFPAVAENVQNFRLVCKVWAQRATTAFLPLRPPLFLARFCDMNKFLDVMSSSELIPAQRYIICEPLLLERRQGLFSTFLGTCSPSAVSLSFINITNFSTLCYKENNPNVNFGKLKSLEICCAAMFRRPSPKVSLPQWIKFLLTAANNLKEFAFTVPFLHFDTKSIKEIINLIPATIKKLRLDICDLNKTELGILVDRKFALEQCELLSLDEKRNLDTSIIKKFLERQAPTLKVLHLECRVPSKFPKMEKLLELKAGSRGILGLPLQDIFPQLKLLDITPIIEFGQVMEICDSREKAPSIKELIFPSFYPYSLMATVLYKASQRFQNVIKLQVCLDSFFRRNFIEKYWTAGFEFFRQLEELNISVSLQDAINGDSLLSRRWYSIINAEVVGKNKVTRLSRNPILNLAKLRKLVITKKQNSWRENRPLTFTNRSVVEVLLQMANLQELQANYCIFKIPAKAFSALQGKLKVMKIDVAIIEEESHHLGLSLETGLSKL